MNHVLIDASYDTNTSGIVSTTANVYDTLSNTVTNSTTYGNQTTVTATGYDEQGRVVLQTDALGNAVSTTYDTAGRTATIAGATYPVQYGYDTAGRMTSLETTRAGTIWDMTQWHYDQATGLVTNKTYADNSTVGYSFNYDYDPLNRVTVRNDDLFDYNARSEVIGATLAPSHTNRYEYDNIGNNHWTSLNSVTNLYTANELNQYINIVNDVAS